MASISSSFHGLNRGNQIGANYGPIYPPIERIETPPPPLSTCPFRRDPDFVDRGTLLGEIYERGCAPAARIALVGLGGVGKSQLAIECCYQIEDRSPQTWVFWIHAANAERFEKSCRDIANRIKIPGRNDPTAKVSQLLHNWLADKRNGKWVIILDNLDDSRFLHKIPAGQSTQDSGDTALRRSLLEYLPISQNGSIIITSRSREAVGGIVEPSDMIMIGPMDAKEATNLFGKKLGVQVTEDVGRLANELDYMPLAIAQAAALIKHREPRLSVSQYLEQFQMNDWQKIRFLTHDQKQLRRDKEAKNTILVTWQISFDHIQQTHPAAADLLSFMCFFDRQGIPESLLRWQRVYDGDEISQRSEEDPGVYEKCESTTQSGDDHGQVSPTSEAYASEVDFDTSSEHALLCEFEESISTLRDYSLISTDVDGTTFEMHRLVQLAMRQWLDAHGQTEWWKQCFIDTLYFEFPYVTFENWSVCRSLIPHVLSSLAQPPTEQRALEKWAQVIHQAAIFALENGDYAGCEDLARLASRTRSGLFGANNERTLDSLGVLGTALSRQGRCQEAENISLRSLDIRKQKLGIEHPATMLNMNNLSSFYYDQGRYMEAERVVLRVLEIQKRILGLEHLHTMSSMGNLSSIYWAQGRYNEAEEIGMQVLETRRRTLGSEYPDTAISMSNLASIYQSQGRHTEAERIGLQAFDMLKRIRGPEHPHTLSCMNNLASVYHAQGQDNKAEELESFLLKTHQRIFGPEHPDTLASMKAYARTLRSRGQYDSALILMTECTRLSAGVFGPEHPFTIGSTRTLKRWHQKNKSLSSVSTKAPIGGSSETRCQNEPHFVLAKASEKAPRPSKDPKRAIFYRFFRK
ncbi:unnamed protein product [Penicillium salamii]|uniref:NB-ARC domain-containing protein n=1 Tax=Penicillium salamii TaxID=1612424 RepID=A0A9W4NXP7_9EURO|nr:unnamed protein product [Penicillium salamii]CAG8335239.1 unnamed protein product [Penicillium salamii]CAG8359142.1 unnamed protein product [Penicillium salamii]CAG8372559.1 unnamed protein product [Penicillium salamii]CAG8397577.1 unnamed protein product [Penicillium salamii]